MAHQEEFRLSGEDVMNKVKEIINAGNARRILIKNEQGETVLEIPLTWGAVGTVLAPAIAVLGAITALITKCTIVVIKRDENDREPPNQPALPA